MDRKNLFIIKYIFSLLLSLACVIIRGSSWEYFITAIACVLMVAVLTNCLCHTKMWIAYVFNTLAMFIINIQYGILFWSNSFITSVMMNNLDSVEALGGKFLQYGITTVFVVTLSILPVVRFDIKRKHFVAACVICVVLYGTICWQDIYVKEPNYALYEVFSQQIRRNRFVSQIENAMGGENDFLKHEVKDYVPKPDTLPDSPNVILIFTEGLSQHIVEDERNIMPNLKALSKKSLVFENYFNHTFATYMGLSGQLYSGYQKNNYDANYLISLQDVFGEYGYQTTFINTEPQNPEFTAYLKDFEFDNLIFDANRLDGINSTMSDKSAYEFLLETALKQNSDKKPFFISMYSFGTHVSFDSVHEKFKDGRDPLLNRFYDMDVQLGKFIEAFEKSPLFENTIFIITADHATYCDSDYMNSFPNSQQMALSLDRVPFFVYYKGVSHKVLDVNGRNSLDMTPTILDYLDMSSENYFLGESLFSPYENSSAFDTVYESFGNLFDTSGGSVKYLKKEQRKNIEEQIAKYFAVKNFDMSTETEYLDEIRVVAEFDPIQFAINTTVTNANEWDNLDYAVWSEFDGQDDLMWYKFSNTKDDDMESMIFLSNHPSAGGYHLHVYGRTGEESEFIASTSFYVTKEALQNRALLHIQKDAQGKFLNTTITNPGDWDSLRYAVWSDVGGQDDVKWFVLENIDRPKAEFKIDLSGYNSVGLYNIHVYANKDGNLFKIAATTFDVPTID